MLHGLSYEAFAQKLGVSSSTVHGWETGRINIDLASAKLLSNEYGVPLQFIYGYPMKIRRPLNEWKPDELQDLERGASEAREYYLFRYGKGEFSGDIDYESEETEKPADEGELSENVVIYHRDGKTVRRTFSKAQLAMISAMLDAIPDENGEDTGL